MIAGLTGTAFAFAAAAALAQTSAPQTAPGVPAQFVTSPEDGKKVHDHISISGETAERLAHICEDIARKNHSQIVVVVLDPYGLVVHEHRMDGEGYIQVKATENKARTALLTRAPSHVLTNRAFNDESTVLRMDQLGLTVQEGGLPIIVNDQLIGAMGAGGISPGTATPSFSEEICVRDALQEVFGPQPPLLPNLGAGGGGFPQRAPRAAGNGG
jgi:uncharacterized protein GlcG (DUF336 family)